MHTEVPGPRSRELWERRTRAIPSAVGTTLPVFIADAGGGIVEDVDGNRFIDMGAGIAVVNVGHAHPTVVAAISEQAANVRAHVLPGDAVRGLRRGLRSS